MIKYKGNCQFRSRAKTSKKGNNGLGRKIITQFLHWMKMFWRWKLGSQLEISSTVLSVMQKGWKIKSITLLAGESKYLLHQWKSDKITQIFILLNYLAVVYPQLQIMLPHWSMLSTQFTDLMTSIPSRDKNTLSAPSSFNQFGSGRVIIVCTDIEIVTPG